MSYIDIETREDPISMMCPRCKEYTNTHFTEWGVNLTNEEAIEFDEEGGHEGIFCPTCREYIPYEQVE